MNDSISADLSYIIEKFDDSLQRFQYNYYLSELAPFRDTIKFVYLAPENNFFDNVRLPCIFFHKGRYRVKLKLHTSKYNRKVPNAYSNYAEFFINEQYIPPDN